MLIERIPEWLRKLAKDAVFMIPQREGEKKVYLTFDDGPIPEVTPRLLDLLDSYGIKATFFMVGDNVRKYPELFADVKRRGHRVGNHTMHHLQGLRESKDAYLADVADADRYIGSDLFRPPHGWMKRSQGKELSAKYRIVMYDLVTRDYSKHLDAGDVFDNVKKYARPGSIIVFHDSLKSLPRLFEALPKSIEWLMEQGYKFDVLFK
ncbi:MAG: polysaccharide deacetylase family protein [Muribaculaceae bacterium]|jgi:peptidoglycan/xylan/chitin deacetylase (PgdA/CDA1 family)|uniref:polysaccharide deacetylase family protein n=1 Tax=Bacteroidales TaxID=171549 RepID=UPI000F51A34A|nr:MULTISPECIES: polysaccharide deacetylase family protein [Bacteroidales]MBJ2192750.1 polysaccharide deacetylase family protein [Muribaculaceae bacterium]ROS82019.1 polysaccharide deacetylase family protein [Muribaculaceae bacterium Isolate-036 (Harlan)]MBJ2197373.1 polysaccharide deacetylase family protein [Muribaculaceae bacterium]MCI9030517.1 polysaccharide deacetylase family protein [Muribaculaceae bacterium]MCX4280186.1 polysaccharide deacetylase family protein [Muribaculaceae bacterium]